MLQNYYKFFKKDFVVIDSSENSWLHGCCPGAKRLITNRCSKAIENMFLLIVLHLLWSDIISLLVTLCDCLWLLVTLCDCLWLFVTACDCLCAMHILTHIFSIDFEVNVSEDLSSLLVVGRDCVFLTCQKRVNKGILKNYILGMMDGLTHSENNVLQVLLNSDFGTLSEWYVLSWALCGVWVAHICCVSDKVDLVHLDIGSTLLFRILVTCSWFK